MASSAQPTRADEPYNNVSIVKYKGPASEVIQIGPVRIDVLEDGRNTDNRIGAVYVTVPPKTPGPLQHWHQVRESYSMLSKTGVMLTSHGSRCTTRRSWS